jgi:hypothetical protein
MRALTNIAIGSGGGGSTKPAFFNREEGFNAPSDQAMHYSITVILLSHLWKPYLSPP